MALVGYARVSTLDQNLDLQLDALKQAGCSQIYSDKVSGVRTDRPNLIRALEVCQRGDVLVVYKLDRLGRSLQHLIETVSKLNDRGVNFKTLQDGLDTGSNGGRLVFHIFGALAEFERGLIRERTLAGLRSARDRGRVGGRPKSMTKEKLAVALKLIESGSTMECAAGLVGVSTVTLWRYRRLAGY